MGVNRKRNKKICLKDKRGGNVVDGRQRDG